jgi:hypothetical protein
MIQNSDAKWTYHPPETLTLADLGLGLGAPFFLP